VLKQHLAMPVRLQQQQQEQQNSQLAGSSEESRDAR
jgi:hypothetical protein